MVAFRGGAGYGKSALLEETVARAQASGFRTLAARPAETEAELPFGVLADLLEPVETSELDLSGPQRRALDIALRRIDPDESHAVDPLGLSLAVVERFGHFRPWNCCSSRSTTCNGATLRRSGRSALLCGASRTHEVGLVIGTRSETGPEIQIPASADRVVSVEVGPLDAAAFGAVVRQGSGARLPLPVIQQLHVACDGNPLFGKEVAR